VLAVLDKRGSLPLSNEGRSSLVGAMVCVHLKQLERARGYFDRAAAYAPANKGFAGHVAAFGERADCSERHRQWIRASRWRYVVAFSDG